MPAPGRGRWRICEQAMSPYRDSASVRGMGVAVIVSRSAPRPFRRRAARWLTPKRCCSSMTTSVRLRKARSSERMAVVPKTHASVPSARQAATCARSAADVAPVTSAQETSAASNRGPSFCAYWRASTEVGAIMAACVPVSATAARATAATAVLPVPTSPRSRRFITCGAAMSRSMSAAARSCSSVSEKGRAARRAATCGPSVMWRWGLMPSSSTNWRVRRVSCRVRSSS